MRLLARAAAVFAAIAMALYAYQLYCERQRAAEWAAFFTKSHAWVEATGRVERRYMACLAERDARKPKSETFNEMMLRHGGDAVCDRERDADMDLLRHGPGNKFRFPQ